MAKHIYIFFVNKVYKLNNGMVYDTIRYENNCTAVIDICSIVNHTCHYYVYNPHCGSMG